MCWKTDRESESRVEFDALLNRFTIDLANDFMYVPTPLTVIWAGHGQRLRKA